MTHLVVKLSKFFLEEWNNIPQAQRPAFTGITGLCVNQDGEVVGDRFPTDVFDSNSAELFYLHGIRGEKWGFHRTEIIEQYPLPRNVKELHSFVKVLSGSPSPKDTKQGSSTDQFAFTIKMPANN